MPGTVGEWVFLSAPILLGAVLLWRFPDSRRFRWRSIVLYIAVMSLLIWGALQLVAWIATARVIPSEIAVVLWFTIAWRLAWEIWSRSVNRLGRSWVRQSTREYALLQPPPLQRQDIDRGTIESNVANPPPPLQGGDTGGVSSHDMGNHSFAHRLTARLLPLGRATLTALVFGVAFLATVATHRCKLADGQDPMSVFGIPFDHVRFPTSDGLTLDGWFVPDQSRNHIADRTIIICHGAGANKGNFIWFLAPLAHQGYNVLFFDFRAHGASDGRTTTYGIRERLDVLAAVDWLKRERPEQSRRIVGLGSSQGSLALALAAADDPRIDAIILDSPFVSPRELVGERTRKVPVIGPLLGTYLLAVVSIETGTNFFAPSAEEAVRTIGPRPVLIIHGDDDFVMPPTHAQRLHDAAIGPREIWFGPGPHSNIVTTTPHDYGRRVLDFLDRTLGS